MKDKNNQGTVFFTLASTDRQRLRAQLLIKSLRSFGGALRDCPIWLFDSVSPETSHKHIKASGVRILPLTAPDSLKCYWFANKVYACAQAEALANTKIHSLVWLSSDCLVIKPPLLFDLPPAFDAAMRPVHIQNIGLLASDPLNGYWKKVYEVIGVQDIEFTIESFVDRQRLRAYFNSHVLAVNPSCGVFKHWLTCFETLVNDQGFQRGACQDERQRIFLHQAILSTLLTTRLGFERIHILPPDYSYPYNLHGQVPPDRRALRLNDLTCIAYEDRSLDPNVVNDIEIQGPLWSWLIAHAKFFK
jgi:hypothetical protein